MVDILKDLLKLAHVTQQKSSIFPSREDFINNYLSRYAKDFVDRLGKFGSTELKDDKLKLSHWHKEFSEGIGELRTYHVLTTGNAQCGKSLFNTLFMVDFLTFSNLNVVWFYPTKTQVDALVPGMFGQVVRNYLKNIESHYKYHENIDLQLIGSEDRQSNQAFQVRGATAYFRYTSTSAKDHTETGRGQATAGRSATSISANVLFMDERSQMSPESVSILFRRLDAARLNGGLVREVGTPGSGLGIESVVKTSDYHFYPHFDCEECLETIPLSPKGCLLKEGRDGKYLSQIGRPVDWYFRDAKDRVGSAYFACSVCGAEISKKTRLAAYFKCLKTGTTHREYIDKLPDDRAAILKNRLTVTYHLSPLLRDTEFNLAANLIKTGLTSDSTTDFQQQALGFESENDAVRITDAQLVFAMNKFVPKNPHTCVIAGIDQGRRQDWMYVCRVWVDGFERLSNGAYLYATSEIETPITRIENATREVLYCGAVNRLDIPTKLNEYGVDYGFIDNEPDVPDAYDLSIYTCLEMANQQWNSKKLIQETEIGGGSLMVKGYNLNAEYFKDSLLNSFVGNKVKLFDIDIHDHTPTSIARHLRACEKDLAKNKWMRAADHIDDLFFAGMFFEAALYKWVDDKIAEYGSSVSWYTQLKGLGR